MLKVNAMLTNVIHYPLALNASYKPHKQFLSSESFSAYKGKDSPLSMTIGDGQPIGLGGAGRLGRSVALSRRWGGRWGRRSLGLGAGRGRGRSGLPAGLAGHEALRIGERRCGLR